MKFAAAHASSVSLSPSLPLPDDGEKILFDSRWFLLRHENHEKGKEGNFWFILHVCATRVCQMRSQVCNFSISYFPPLRSAMKTAEKSSQLIPTNMQSKVFLFSSFCSTALKKFPHCNVVPWNVNVKANEDKIWNCQAHDTRTRVEPQHLHKSHWRKISACINRSVHENFFLCLAIPFGLICELCKAAESKFMTYKKVFLLETTKTFSPHPHPHALEFVFLTIAEGVLGEGRQKPSPAAPSWRVSHFILSVVTIIHLIVCFSRIIPD